MKNFKLLALLILPMSFFGQNNFFITESKGLFGVLDEKGREIVTPKYEQIDAFGEVHKNWAVVTLNNKVGLIDSDGNELLKASYDKINKFDTSH